MVNPQAQEAFTVAESNWYEANGIEPGAEGQAWARKLAQDMWAAALQWAAQQAKLHDARGYKCPSGISINGQCACSHHNGRFPFAALLRQEAVTPSPEGKP